jgi:hypothetical protein
MISIICSPVLILLIVSCSILVSALYEIDTALTTNAAIAAAQPISKQNNTVVVDKFGIREIYPTKPLGGREWYVNMSFPLNDKSFYLSGGGENTNSSAITNVTSSNSQLIKQADGSYQVHGVRKIGKYDFSVRMNVNTSDTDSAHWWKNVELTGYVKVISANASDASIDWYARGRMHTSQSPCEGMAYHAGLQTDGTVFWQKEIWHTGGYTGSRSNLNATHSILGKWIGFKAIMSNVDNDSAVRMETYLDDNATNHWRKVMDTIDNGGWHANAPDDLFYSANCGRSKDYVILNAGPIATYRSDNIIWDFKDLSIREIQAPSDIKGSTAKQLTTNTTSR